MSIGLSLLPRVEPLLLPAKGDESWTLLSTPLTYASGERPLDDERFGDDSFDPGLVNSFGLSVSCSGDRDGVFKVSGLRGLAELVGEVKLGRDP
jgi:hypothetical protein